MTPAVPATPSEDLVIDVIDQLWDAHDGASWLEALAARGAAGSALRKIAIQTLIFGRSATLEALRLAGHAAGMSDEDRVTDLREQAALWARVGVTSWVEA